MVKTIKEKKETTKKEKEKKTTNAKKEAKETKKDLKEKNKEIKVTEVLKKKDKYFESVGKRKRAIARVRIIYGSKEFLVNEKKIEDYFRRKDLQEKALLPFEKTKCLDVFGISVRVEGSGIVSQADAIAHGISRNLVLYNEEFRKKLRKAELLTRDPRKRERKKFGLKRARRARQWRKRQDKKKREDPLF